MPTILLAEDDTFLLKVYKAKLKKAGYTVELAADGKELIEKCQQNTPDLIVVDIIMPQHDGFMALEELAKVSKFAAIPKLVLSQLTQPEDVQRAAELGAVEFLKKTEFTFSQVVEKISAHLNK